MLKNILNYAINKTFHFAVIVGLTLGAASLFIQAKILNNQASKIEVLDEQLISSMDQTIKLFDILQEFNESEVSILNSKVSILNAKIDVLDSAIDPDMKRRKLIKLVREAIKDNTITQLDIRSLNKISIAVVDNSFKYGLKISDILAQIRQESNFDDRAHSKAGAVGLLQIMPFTGSEIAGDLDRKHYNLWDISTNIEFGCYYQSKMISLFGDYNTALAAYNFGPQNVKRVKAGEVDYSLSRILEENGKETQYLVDRKGERILDFKGNKIIIQEEHKYPRETREYIKLVNKYREIFNGYGLGKIE